tara:strand:- start:375 stop:644 length:270 start_codon:yes stop_codon:yes gene_type:complete
METNVLAAVTVSALAMGVIFLVLTSLIFTIQALVKLMPYEEPPTSPARKIAINSATSGQNDEIAVITASLAAHMGKRPDEFRILNIQSH